MANVEINPAFLESSTAFIRSSVTASFKPVAYFDEELDCVRVIIRDCSVTEVRINEHLTIAEDNYPTNPADRYVGFTVKGVRHFLRSKKESPQVTAIGAVLEQMLAELPTLIGDADGKTLVDMAVSISFALLERVEEKEKNVPLKLAA